MSLRVAGKKIFGLWQAALLCAASVAARPAHAEAPQVAQPPAAKPVDTPTPWGRTGAPGVDPTSLRWHDTYMYWDHAVSTTTLGVGRDYQSNNPVYEMTIGLRPRYYFLESQRTSISARGDLGVVTERTNSDTTTREGEWSLADTELWGAFSYKLRESRGDLTELAIRVPRLTFPTSKVSYDSGKLLGVGARIGVREDIVLQGRDSAFLPNIELIAKAEYGYLFSNSRVPTSGALERIRLDADGRSIVSDQLSGASLAQHSAAFGVASLVHVQRNLLWTTSLDLRPAWKYPVDHDVQICGVVLTGCTQASGVADPQTRSALTYFQTEFWLTMTDVLGLTAGYANLSAQLGPDGRRRNALYSPDARFYLTLSVGLDQLYSGLTHNDRQSASLAGEPQRH